MQGIKSEIYIPSFACRAIGFGISSRMCETVTSTQLLIDFLAVKTNLSNFKFSESFEISLVSNTIRVGINPNLQLGKSRIFCADFAVFVGI